MLNVPRLLAVATTQILKISSLLKLQPLENLTQSEIHEGDPVS